eukprot:s1968_g22.t1
MVQASATSATSSIYTSCGCDFDVFCKLFPIYFPGIFAKAIYATIAARQREALKNLANSKAKVAFCPILKGAIIESWAASQMIAMDAESWKSWKSLQEILEKCEEQLAIAEQWVAPEDLMSKLSSTQKQAVGNAMSASPGSWVEQCSRRHVSCIAATHPCAVGDSRAMSHAKLFSAGRSRGCIRRRVGCVKGFPGRTPWRYLRFSATLLVQGIRLLVFALLVAPACLYIGLQYFRSPQIDRAVRYGQKPRQFLDIYYPTKEATSSTGNPPVVITVMGDPGSCAKRQDLKMAMLWASCCNHPTTNDSDVVNVQEGEPLLGATWLTQKATIDAKETERTAAEAVEETLQVQDTGAETSPKRAVSEVDPIKKIINSVAPMVRNRIDTRTRKNPMPSRRFTAGVGAAAPASPPTSPTDPADAAAGASAASAAARASAASAASTARASAASAARSSSASAVNGDRGSQRNSQMSQRSTKRTRNSAMSNHSSASAMFLQGIGIDVRRRGRASVLSHHHGRVREDYELLESLGVGGFGEVFRGQRKQDGHLCAIKSVDLEKTDPEVFQIELDQARQLKHPNVVRLLSAYRDETAFWLVMELYPGGDLMGEILDYNFRRSEDNGFWTVGIPDDRLARYAYQIFSGLAYLHYHKIVHRDWATESGWFLGIPH